MAASGVMFFQQIDDTRPRRFKMGKNKVNRVTTRHATKMGQKLLAQFSEIGGGQSNGPLSATTMMSTSTGGSSRRHE